MNAKLKNGSGRSFSDVKFVLFINWFWTINFSIWALAKELLPKLMLILKSKSRRWTLQLWAIKIQSSNKFLDSATISSQKFIVITCWKWKLGIWAQRSPTAICKLQFHIYIYTYPGFSISERSAVPGISTYLIVIAPPARISFWDGRRYLENLEDDVYLK